MFYLAPINIMASLIIAIFVVVFAAVVTFYGFQKEDITTNLSRFIKASPELVYLVISEPQHWTKLHHSMLSVNITKSETTAEGDKRYDYIIASNTAHIGNHNVDATLVAYPRRYDVHINVTTFPYGLVAGKVHYHVAPSSFQEEKGAQLTEIGQIIAPRLLRSFVQRITLEKHGEILDNIKMLCESPQVLDLIKDEPL